MPTALPTPAGEGRAAGGPSRGDSSGEGAAADTMEQDSEGGGQDTEGEVRTGAQDPPGGLDGGSVTRQEASRRRKPKAADLTGGQGEPMRQGEWNAGGGVNVGGASETGQASGTVGSDGVYRPKSQENWDAGQHLRVSANTCCRRHGSGALSQTSQGKAYPWS